MSDEPDKLKPEFAIPRIPPSRSVVDSKSESIGSSAVQQQADKEAIKKFPVPLTNLQPNQNVFFVEIIKNGVVASRHYLNKNCIYIGRAVDCDLVFEHCSISRYHAALYWKENNQNLDDNGFFYLTDLSSSHGTFHNKTQLEQNKFLKLEPNKSFIKLGASSRLLVFSSIDDETEDESDQIVSNQSNQKHEFKSDPVDSDACSWGMDMDYDWARRNVYAQSDTGLQAVLRIMNENTVIDKTENENSYIANPSKAIQNWFDYEGYEYEYTMTNENNKFRCTFEFPIEDQHVPISGEDELKKKDAINSACLRACRILDRASILFAWQKNNRFEKHKKGSDEDDDDALIDETGEKESKKMRLEALKNRKVDNLDTLNKRSEELNQEIETLKTELSEMDQEINVMKGGRTKERNDDELEQYMKTMSSNKYNLNDLKIKKSKTRMKMSQLLKEKERTERLIKIAQPSQSSYKVKETMKSSKVNDLLEKAKAKLNEKKLEESKSTDTIVSKVVKLDAFTKNEETDLPIEKNEVKKQTTGFTLNRPSIKGLLKSNTFGADDEKVVEKRKLINLEDDEEVDKKRIIRLDTDDIEVNKKAEVSTSSNFKKIPQKPQFAKPKNLSRRDENESMDDDKFVEWLPPDDDQNQISLDEAGQSHLNKKYGY